MKMPFGKMHGLGNDFVMVDNSAAQWPVDAERARRLADRRFGIGCDQVIVVERARGPDAELRMRIFNADGGEVEHCGNGARCFAVFARDRGLSTAETLKVETTGRVFSARIVDGGAVAVDMGTPQLEPAALPFVAARRERSYRVATEAGEVTLGIASMGNPHAVIQVPDVAAAPVERVGPALQGSPRFPASVNVGFMEVLDRHRARLRVFERGVGETLACGTGACAAVVVGRSWGLLESSVQMHLAGGRLDLSWEGEGEPVWMTGPATWVFEGEIEL